MIKKWVVVYATERIEKFDADNINDALEKAKREKRPGERIVSISAIRNANRG